MVSRYHVLRQPYDGGSCSSILSNFSSILRVLSLVKFFLSKCGYFVELFRWYTEVARERERVRGMRKGLERERG